MSNYGISMPKQNTFPYRLLALFVIIVWGLSFIATKYLYAVGLGPYTVLTLRTLLAYGVLVLLCPHQIFANSLRDEFKLFLLGIVCVPIYYGLENLALVYTSASAVAALMATAPLMTAVIVLLRWHDFRLHWMSKLGICAAATGTFLVLFDTQIMQNLPGAGALFCVGAAFSWAVYSALLKSFSGYSGAFVARKAFGYGLLTVFPFYLAEGPAQSAPFLAEPEVIALLFFLAAGPTTLCTVLWNRAAVIAGASSVNHYLYWVPVVTIAAGMTLLGETMSFVGLMGAAMILCGVWSSETGMKRVSAVLSGADPEKLSARISF